MPIKATDLMVTDPRWDAAACDCVHLQRHGPHLQHLADTLRQQVKGLAQ